MYKQLSHFSHLYDHITMSIPAVQWAILGYHDNLAIFSKLVYIFLPLTQNTIILWLWDTHELQENK
jgi:hypothetical protein